MRDFSGPSWILVATIALQSRPVLRSGEVLAPCALGGHDFHRPPWIRHVLYVMCRCLCLIPLGILVLLVHLLLLLLLLLPSVGVLRCANHIVVGW